MAAKKSPALDFTREYLRKKPEATFAEIRDAAAEKDLKIYPIVFGRAKALEGLVKVAPYGSKKKARAAKKNPQPEPAQGGDAAEAALGSIETVIEGMRENHAERERYREALIRISEILDDVL